VRTGAVRRREGFHGLMKLFVYEHGMFVGERVLVNHTIGVQTGALGTRGLFCGMSRVFS
jgi:hypothetical protein